MTATIADRATNENLIKEVPCYNYFSLMGKDGPWKEVLAKHCRKALRSGSLRSLRSLQSKESPGQAYLDALIKMLQDAVLEVEQMDLQYWSANTGWNNLWYAGWRLMAWRYLKVFRDSSLHKIQSKTEFARARARITKAHLAGLVLTKLTGKVVDSLSEYHGVVRHTASLLEKVKAPMLPGNKKYGIPWDARGKVTAEMRQGGVQSLEFTESDTVELLMQAFPDQHDWLKVLATPDTKVKKLVKDLHYKLPLELLTMYLCFYGTIQAVPTDKLLRLGVLNLRRLRQQYRAEHGVTPHLANLVQMALEQQAN